MSSDIQSVKEDELPQKTAAELSKEVDGINIEEAEKQDEKRKENYLKMMARQRKVEVHINLGPDENNPGHNRWLKKEYKYKMLPTTEQKEIDIKRAEFSDLAVGLRGKFTNVDIVNGRYDWYKIMMTKIFGMKEDEFETCYSRDLETAIEIYDKIQAKTYPL